MIGILHGDESLYIYVLDAVLEAPFLDEVSKMHPAHLLELALKNRVGEPATDFTYTLVDGKKGTNRTKADCLLLFFYNPDCHACKEITDQLAGFAVVTEVDQRITSLKSLTIYRGLEALEKTYFLYACRLDQFL